MAERRQCTYYKFLPAVYKEPLSISYPLLLKISNQLSSHPPVLQANTFGSSPAEEGSEWKDRDEFGPEVNPQHPFCALSVQSCCPSVWELRGLQITEIPDHTSHKWPLNLLFHPQRVLFSIFSTLSTFWSCCGLKINCDKLNFSTKYPKGKQQLSNAAVPCRQSTCLSNSFPNYTARSNL